jgi:hypothetical protein
MDARFATGGDYADLLTVVTADGYSYVSAVYADAAVALYQHGKGASIDLSALKDNYSLLYGAGQLAKAAMIFKAAGVDPSLVEIDGTVHDVIAEMESALFADGSLAASIYDLVYVLPAYEFTGAALSDSAASQIIDAILAAQVTDAADECYGLFGTVSEYQGVTYDSHGTQVTAQAALALAPYKSRADVASAIELATAAIDKLQNSDGSFNEGYGFNAYASIDSTASVVSAYAALGKDAQAACAFLVNESAGSNYAGYDNSTLSYDPSYTAPTALMGTVAYERAAEMGGTYNMFGEYVAAPANDAASVESSSQSASAAEDVLAATGDSTAATGVLTVSGALAALVMAGAAVVRSRRRVA